MPQLPDISQLFAAVPGRAIDWITGGVVLLVGLVLARWLGRAVRHAVTARGSAQHGLVAGRVLTYVASLVVVLVALEQAGLDLTVLLGAAGVLTLALGFAAQTSTSNLISGLFLMAERPFVLGDTIEMGTVFGEVASIDLLSVKVRTFDNRWVRIPNESMLKQDIVNHTRFPIRRADLELQVPYAEDPERVQAILLRLAEADPDCLDEPKPTLFVLGFGESGLRLRFTAWSTTESFIPFKSRFQVAIRRGLVAEGVAFAAPRRVVEMETSNSTPRPLPNETETSNDG